MTAGRRKRLGFSGCMLTHLTPTASPSSDGMARKSPEYFSSGRYSLGGMTASPRPWAANARSTAGIASSIVRIFSTSLPESTSVFIGADVTCPRNERQHNAMEKMNESARKYLFVSHDALIHDLAWEVLKEGHAVRYCILSKQDQDVADGLLEKVADWKAHTEWADVVVFDDTGFGEAAERLRREGRAVIGGTRASDRLEQDRDFGQSEMKAAGMNILPNWDFDSFDAAIDFIRKTPDRYVVKPNGKAQNDKVLSFVGQEDDGRDLITMLEHYKKGWGSKIRSFQLQKYASGVEVAVGAFFNGKDFILPALVNFEHKRMFNDEIGPSTGEMGTTSFWANENELYRRTLAKMKDRIQGYVGYIDINCIVNSHGIYPLEFTTR